MSTWRIYDGYGAYMILGTTVPKSQLRYWIIEITGASNNAVEANKFSLCWSTCFYPILYASRIAVSYFFFDFETKFYVLFNFSYLLSLKLCYKYELKS